MNGDVFCLIWDSFWFLDCHVVVHASWMHFLMMGVQSLEYSVMCCSGRSAALFAAASASSFCAIPTWLGTQHSLTILFLLVRRESIWCRIFLATGWLVYGCQSA